MSGNVIVLLPLVFQFSQWIVVLWKLTIQSRTYDVLVVCAMCQILSFTGMECRPQ